MTERIRRMPSVRNIAEHLWQQLPGHFDGALSKLLVHPETNGSRHLDHRISTYQPMGYVAPHTHRVQEQIYHVLDGEGLVQLGSERRVVRQHDVVFVPPGVEHALYNTGTAPLTFLVITSPVSDDDPEAA